MVVAEKVGVVQNVVEDGVERPVDFFNLLVRGKRVGNLSSRLPSLVAKRGKLSARERTKSDASAGRAHRASTARMKCSGQSGRLRLAMLKYGIVGGADDALKSESQRAGIIDV
jgi:hypothetical protein